MARIPVGRIGTAPCGHRGEYVIGRYIQCLEGCELKAEDYPSIEFCPRCGKNDIDFEFEIDPVYYVWNPGADRVNRRCFNCGSCWVQEG